MNPKTGCYYENHLESSSLLKASTDTSSNIALPKPNGQWIEDSETETETFFDTQEHTDSVPSQIHVPEATRRQLQRLSIQEINLYEQEQETIEATEVIHIHKEVRPTIHNPLTTEDREPIEITEPVAIVKESSNTTKEDSIEEIEKTDVLSSPVHNEITSAKESTVENTSPEQTMVLPSVLMEIEDTAAIEPTQTISANNPRLQPTKVNSDRCYCLCISIFTMALIPYTSPNFADYRPWIPMRPSSYWTLDATTQMTEDASGSIVVVDEDIVENEEPDLVLLEDALEENIEEEETLSAINEIAVVIPKEDTLEPLNPAHLRDLKTPCTHRIFGCLLHTVKSHRRRHR